MSKTKKIPDIVRHVRSHPPNPIDYSANQKNISFSQLTTYHQCPKKWAWIYRDKRKVFSSNISTIFGNALHFVIQHYLTVFYNESAVAADEIDLEDLFHEAFKREYKEAFIENKRQHFSSVEEMDEYFQDAVKLLYDFKKYRGKYFSKRGWHLVGVEVPIIIPPHEKYPDIFYLGYLDVVLYHEETNTIKIIDIKSSKSGWYDNYKKDPNKTNQLLSYKKYFSEQYNFPIDNIEVEFFILKRKIYEEAEFAQKHIQTFIPPNGKNKIRLAGESITGFIEEVFNPDNTIKNLEFPKQPSRLCDWCPFKSECL